MGAFELERLLYRDETCLSRRRLIFKATGGYRFSRRGGPSDSKIFDRIVTELIRRRVLRKGDRVIWDKGFYAYKHYVDCIRTYGIVPMIVPRRNFTRWKVVKGIQLDLDFFNDKKDRIKKKIALLRQLLQEFKQKITHWKDFMFERSLIEDIFNAKKKTFSLDHLHKQVYLRFRRKAHRSGCPFGWHRCSSCFRG